MGSDGWWSALGTWAAVVLSVVGFVYMLHRNRAKALSDAMAALKTSLTVSVDRIGAEVEEFERHTTGRLGTLDDQLRTIERDVSRNYVRKEDWVRQSEIVDQSMRRVEGKVDDLNKDLGGKLDELNRYLRDANGRAR